MIFYTRSQILVLTKAVTEILPATVTSNILFIARLLPRVWS